MSNYPLTVTIDYKEQQGRLITFFKLILAIPWMIFLSLWAIAFELLSVLVWFILLFTAKYPEEFFRFNTGFMRFQMRYYVWIYNLTDQWPGWNGQPDPAWGVNLEIQHQERYSRAKTFFRYFLSFPLMMLSMGVGLYIYVFWFVGFWAVIFTGRMPRWCYQHLADCQSWVIRANAYIWLLTEKFPPFKGQDSLGN